MTGFRVAAAADREFDSDKRLAWTAEQVAGGKLEKTIEETVGLNLATVQARLAEELVNQGDVDQAIAKYREAVRLSPQGGFQQRLDDIEAAWQIKDNDHRTARTFVLEVWPKAQITRLDELQAVAEQAFGKLEEVDDYLTASQLFKATHEHICELSDLVALLSQRGTEADRRQCEQYIELTDRMARFHREVGAYLNDRLEKSPDADAPAKKRPDQKPSAANGTRSNSPPGALPRQESERNRQDGDSP